MKEIAGTEERICNVYMIARGGGQSHENKSCPPLQNDR